MSSRSDILSAVRAHLPNLEKRAPVIPSFDADVPANWLELFSSSLRKMGGQIIDAGPRPVLEEVRARLAAASVTCSMVPEAAGNRQLTPATPPRDLADIDIAVLRAAFAVAETGSICLTEAELGVNALGYLPQHLIILLDPADIIANIHQAYKRSEFRTAMYAVFHTGPSATADIEGVLIHGAQGVRSLSVAFVNRNGAHSGAGNIRSG